MRKFLTSALCFIPTVAGAGSITLYYTPGGECPGLYLNPSATGCPGDSDRVVKLNVAKRADAVFAGFQVDGVEIVDSAGNVKSNAAATLATADTSTKITGDYTCQTGTSKNTNGVCVNALSLQTSTNENVAYVDWASVVNNTNLDSGHEIEPNQIKDDGAKGCGYDRDFDIVIHWCPENYTGVNYSYGGAHIEYATNTVDWSSLPCDNATDTYHYHWNGGTSLGVYTKNGVTQTELVFPSATGWSPRGLYIVSYPEFKPKDSSFNNIPYYSVLKTVADNLVTEQTTTWGRARLGLPFNQTNITDRIILDNQVNGYGDANANWQIWTCDGDITTVHMYAAWARDCDPDSGATCTRQIQRNGLSNPDKGDTMYYTSCTTGTISGDGTYKPSCGTCSESNPGMCGKTDCNNLTNTRWCVVDATPQCITSLAVVKNLCCNDTPEKCDKEWACDEVGGTWNADDETCSAGSTPPQ